MTRRAQPRFASGDTFGRRLIDNSKDVYQCGCRWERQKFYGDVLIECPIHKAAGASILAALRRRGSCL